MMERGNVKEVSDHVVRSGWESYGDSWSQVNEPLVQEVISGSETDEVWLMTELTTKTVDLSLEILKAKLVLSEFFDLLIVEMERPVRMCDWHWFFLGTGFMGLNLFHFPFFMSHKQHRIIYFASMC